MRCKVETGYQYPPQNYPVKCFVERKQAKQLQTAVMKERKGEMSGSEAGHTRLNY